MPKLIALLQFLLALVGIGVDGTSYNTRVASNGHDVLDSRTHVVDGVARFDCRASDSGLCYYTLYPATCTGKTCTDAPMRRFSVAHDQSRQFTGLAGFHPCVDTTDAALGPDCKPRAVVAKR